VVPPSATLIPGWRLGRGPLMPLADRLGAAWHDLPGYGTTPFTADFATALAHLHEAIPVQTVLVGWSLGAMVALAAAAQGDKRITGVVVLAGTPSFIQRSDWPHGLSPEALAEFRQSIAADEAAMLPRFVGGFNRGDANAKAITALILAAADPSPPLPVLLAGLTWLAELDLRPLLPTISCPVLVIHGENDPLIPATAGRAIAASVANGAYLGIDAAAHAPFLSAPERVAAAISSFLVKCR